MLIWMFLGAHTLTNDSHVSNNIPIDVNIDVLSIQKCLNLQNM